jgi:hypothetical protein
MRFGTTALGSPVRYLISTAQSPHPSSHAIITLFQVRFGAHSHSSPPLSFLPAPRPSAGANAALGSGQKSLPPFSLMDCGGDSRGSLGMTTRELEFVFSNFLYRRTELEHRKLNVGWFKCNWMGKTKRLWSVCYRLKF